MDKAISVLEVRSVSQLSKVSIMMALTSLKRESSFWNMVATRVRRQCALGKLKAVSPSGIFISAQAVR